MNIYIHAYIYIHFGVNERVIVMGDMNAKVGDREREGVTVKYGVPDVNENGERLVEVCAERRMSVGNTWFQKRLCQKYTREGEGGQGRSLIDYVLVDERNRGEKKMMLAKVFYNLLVCYYRCCCCCCCSCHCCCCHCYSC